MPFYQRVTRRRVVLLSFFHACFIAVSRHTSSSETRKFFYSVINIQLLKHVLTRTHSPLPPLLAVIFHPSWRETGEGSNGEEATSRTPQPLICRKFHSTTSHFSSIPNTSSLVDFLPLRQWRGDTLTRIITRVPSTNLNRKKKKIPYAVMLHVTDFYCDLETSKAFILNITWRKDVRTDITISSK